MHASECLLFSVVCAFPVFIIGLKGNSVKPEFHIKVFDCSFILLSSFSFQFPGQKAQKRHGDCQAEAGQDPQDSQDAMMTRFGGLEVH